MGWEGMGWKGMTGLGRDGWFYIHMFVQREVIWPRTMPKFGFGLDQVCIGFGCPLRGDLDGDYPGDYGDYCTLRRLPWRLPYGGYGGGWIG